MDWLATQTPSRPPRRAGRRVLVGLAVVSALVTCTEDRTPTAPLITTALMEPSIAQALLTAGTNATNQKVYATDSIAPAPNALITVAVLGRSIYGAAIPTVTGGGMPSWALVASVAYDPLSGPLSGVTVFRAMSNALGAGPLTITFPKNVSNATWIVSQWTGVDTSGANGAGAIVQIDSAHVDAVTTLSTTLGAFADANDVAFGVVGVGMNGPAVTPGAGFTEIAEPTSGENNLLEAEWGVDLTDVAASWTAAKNAGLLAMEIKAGTGGGSGGGGVSGSQSTVTAAPASIAAGSGTATITVTAKDTNGNPVSGATVVLSATGSGNTLTQPSGPTNASGVATGTLSSTVAEVKTVSATANGVAITQTATVTVTSGTGATIAQTLLAAGANDTNQKVFTTASIAPAPTALITVAVLGRSIYGAAIPTVTGGGMETWTLVASVAYDPLSGPLSGVTVFRAMSNAPGSGPLTITFPKNVSNATWIVSQWTGVDTTGANGAGAIVQVDSAQADAVTMLSTTLGAFTDANDVAYGVVGVGMTGPAVTPGTGFTEIAEPTSGESNLLEGEWGVNLPNVSASWTAAKNAGLLALEIRAGTGGGALPINPDNIDIPDDSQFVIASPDDTAFIYFRTMAEVQFKSTATSAQVSAFLSRFGAQVVGGSLYSGTYIIRYSDPGSSWAEVDGFLDSIQADPAVMNAGPMTRYEGPPIIYARYPSDGQNLKRSNWTSSNVSDTAWALRAVRAPMAWGCENGLYGGPRIKVGVFEWSFDPSHPDIAASRTAPIFNARGSGGVSVSSDSLALLAWHGTMVAGTISATGDNDTGVVGLSWRTDLRLYKLGPSNAGVTFSEKGVFEQALAKASQDGIRVLSLSIGLNTDNDPRHGVQQQTRLVADFRKFLDSTPGAVIVVATGDAGTTSYTPQELVGLRGGVALITALMSLRLESQAYADRIILVTGTSRSGGLWNDPVTGIGADYYLNGGTDIAAPAEKVAILGSRQSGHRWSGDVVLASGTSISAPMTAGLAADLISMDPSLTPALVEDYIIRGAKVSRYDPATGHYVSPPQVSGTSVYQLDAYGSLQLLSQEHFATTPICGYPIEAVDSGVLLEPLNASPHFLPAPSGWFIAAVSLAQGGRLISADEEDNSPSQGAPRLWSFQNGGWTGPTSAGASGYFRRLYLEKDTVYVKLRPADTTLSPSVGSLPLFNVKRADGTSSGDLDLYTPQFPPDAMSVTASTYWVGPRGDWSLITLIYSRAGDGACVDVRQRFVNLRTLAAFPAADRVVTGCPYESGSVVQGAAFSNGGDEAMLARDTSNLDPNSQSATRLVKVSFGSMPVGTDSLDIANRVIYYLRYLQGDGLILTQEWVAGEFSCSTELRSASTVADLAMTMPSCPYSEWQRNYANIGPVVATGRAGLQDLEHRHQGPVQAN